MNRAILVKSCRRFQSREAACRSTWASLIPCRGVPVYFARGGCLGPSIDNMLFGELQLSTGDAYQDNSLKVREALRLLLEKPFDQIFICDDDTFVHPRRWLEHEPAGEFECRLFHPRTDHEKTLNDGRPWAHGGGGWWMSRRMCELYVANVTERRSCDDVFAARVAQDHGIEIVDRPDLYSGDRYSGEAGQRVAADNTLITCHHVRPPEMLKLYEATRGL